VYRLPVRRVQVVQVNEKFHTRAILTILQHTARSHTWEMQGVWCTEVGAKTIGDGMGNFNQFLQLDALAPTVLPGGPGAATAGSSLTIRPPLSTTQVGYRENYGVQSRRDGHQHRHMFLQQALPPREPALATTSLTATACSPRISAKAPRPPTPQASAQKPPVPSSAGIRRVATVVASNAALATKNVTGEPADAAAATALPGLADVTAVPPKSSARSGYLRAGSGGGGGGPIGTAQAADSMGPRPPTAPVTASLPTNRRIIFTPK
jgi:hypothetical protein